MTRGPYRALREAERRRGDRPRKELLDKAGASDGYVPDFLAE